MEVIIVKEIPGVDEVAQNVCEVVDNMRHSNPHVITDEDICNTLMFEKARSLKRYVEGLMALEPTDEANLNNVSQEVFDKYVAMGKCTDHYFALLMEDYHINDCDEECCDDCPCGDTCNQCNCDDDGCEDCKNIEMANDMLKMVDIMKPAFPTDDVGNEEKIFLTMTPEEYRTIKAILDKYECRVDYESDRE